MIKNDKTDKKWVKSGEVIDTGAKVYGFRVDNVHSETYRMWNGMQRNAINGEEIIELVGQEGDESDKGSEFDENGNRRGNEDSQDGKKKRKKTFLKFKENEGNKTLDTLKNLDVTNFDTQHQADPLFNKTTRMFDEMSIGSLLTSSL